MGRGLLRLSYVVGSVGGSGGAAAPLQVEPLLLRRLLGLEGLLLLVGDLAGGQDLHELVGERDV